MKHSIRMRYTSVLVLALTAIIGCVVLFNCFYLESYVTSQKKKAVQETISLGGKLCGERLGRRRGGYLNAHVRHE